ncbi:DHA2 family efflux MFS transporter permease subunit [Saxibacter everestensis]|uniref:DHA2 family efflux MFS transporter permease subunit n=1 Tax=Saxibacter everestensis TaxID=2909229 RepID=A0ABY8QYD2_9MICO|nr:DHA2 family efflux MFS transporter permease subunit [Brevibacteriaceae bacterium ZFBP1038]
MRNRKVIYLLLAAAFVVILNETILSVALPHLMNDLAVSASTAQWLSTAFMLTMAIVIPITGFLIQRINTRPMFTAAMTLFSVGTLTAFLAPGFVMLLVGRIIQATGTAIMMPLLMTTVLLLVPAARRGKVMGNISIVIAVAPAIGPTISGIILSVGSWRWMFGLVLPIAVAMLLYGMRRVENVSEPKRVPIDGLSVVLSAFAFGGLVYGLSQAGEGAAGNSVAPMVISLVVSAITMTAFITRQIKLQRSDRALLDLRTFRIRTFTIAILMMTTSMMALFGTIIVLPIYLQNVIRLDAFYTGLLMLPGGLLMGLAAPFVGRLYDKVGPRVLLVPGTIIVSSVLWLLTMVTESTSPFAILAAHILLSLGLALLFTPLFTSGLGSLTPDLYSHGSAIVGTVQQVAAAAGTALFITLMASRTAALTAAGSAPAAAAAGGVRMAFLVGAAISLLSVVAAFFVRKPETEPATHGG